MNKKTSIAIYALHPITYQTPIFEDLHNKLDKEDLGIDIEVLFGDDLSLREVFYEHLKSLVKFDNDLRLEKFPNKFLKNYARDARRGFFSRINPGIFLDIVINRRDIVLVHGYATFTTFSAIIFAKLLSRKVIFRGESVLEGNNNKILIRIIKKIILQILFFFIDKFAYSCEGNRRFFQHYGVKSEKLFFMPCAVNNEYFLNLKKQIAPQIGEIKDRYNVPIDHFIILFCARFTARKRPVDLIKAVCSIDHKKITILFVGDGPERNLMEEEVRKSGINAIFTGFLITDEVAKLESISDVSVNLSSMDPSPKSVNQAMLFSLPIIITDVVGTAHDLVENGINGFIIKVGDIKALAEHLKFLEINKKLRLEMGRKSLEKVICWNFSVGTLNLINAIKSLKK
jgi:glycosyltransferase involved in cell wall biosynthesis